MSCSSCSKKMIGPYDNIKIKEDFSNYHDIKRLRKNRILFFILLVFLCLFLVYIILKEI